jgi:hypothetical protein
MADVAAVKHLGLIGLGDGNPAVPSDLGCVITEPDDLKPVQVAKFGHCMVHIEVSETGTDHVKDLPTRSAREGAPKSPASAQDHRCRSWVTGERFLTRH